MRSLAVVVCLTLLTAPVAAQGSPARFGIEGGFLYATVDGSDFDGLDNGTGFHAQGRLILQAFSVGAGFVRTNHGVDFTDDDIAISGFVLEPRYTFPMEGPVHPFVGARLGFLNQSLKTTVPGFGSVDAHGPGNVFGAGVGVTFSLARQVDLNVLATYNKLSFSDVTINGTKQSDSDTHGSSFTAQIGVAYVFGARAK